MKMIVQDLWGMLDVWLHCQLKALHDGLDYKLRTVKDGSKVLYSLKLREIEARCFHVKNIHT